MSDSDLRELERAWHESGSPQDLEALLVARERSGSLNSLTLQAAAYLGSEVAERFLSAEFQLAHKPPKTGVARFLELLPTPDDEVRLRAALLGLRAIVDAGFSELSAEGREVTKQLESWLEGGRGAASDSLREAYQGLVAQIEEADWFAPEPKRVMGYGYEEAGATIAAWVLGRHAVAGSPLSWSSLVRAIADSTPSGRKAQQTVRGAISAGLVPWLLSSKGPAPESASVPERSGPSLMGPEERTAAVAAAVLEAAPAGSKLDSFDAYKIVNTFFLARGYQAKRSWLVDPSGVYRVKLGERNLKLEEGGPGKWKKLAANDGRPILLKATAEHLLALAREELG